MSKSRRNLGIWGENKAAAYLLAQGYDLIAQNVRTDFGEIDIVVQKEGVMVFVEVKTRRTRSYGYPEEGVTPKKREHLIHSALAYLRDHPEVDGEWQIDVIAIETRYPGPPEIIHFENAISE
ncbi:MAG: YraN family protein [Anaerolineales bacterium]|nr:YraN family protein [Anaerolineales bacterium]